MPGVDCNDVEWYRASKVIWGLAERNERGAWSHV